MEARLCCETLKTDLTNVNSNIANIHKHIMAMRSNIEKKASKIKVNKIKEEVININEKLDNINTTALELILNQFNGNSTLAAQLMANTNNIATNINNIATNTNNIATNTASLLNKCSSSTCTALDIVMYEILIADVTAVKGINSVTLFALETKVLEALCK